MGSYLAKNAKLSEVMRALRCGALQPQSALDWAIAHAIIHVPGMSTDAQKEAWHSRYFCDPTCKLYLPFDEASGATAHDLSGNGNMGTATGTTIVDGVFGKARSFDGIDDRVVVLKDASLDVPANGQFSIEAWFKLDQLPSNAGNDMTIFRADDYGMEGTDATRSVYFLRISSTDYLEGAAYENGMANSVTISDTTKVSTGVWYHAAFTIDMTGDAYLYRNGSQVASVNASALNNEINPATSRDIGAWYNHGNSLLTEKLNGIIDEVRFYSRALTADEIYLHYLAGALKLGLI